MARILSENGHSLPGIYEFMVEEASEIENLEVSEYVRPGSKLYCLEDSKTYMLNNSGEWVEVNFKKGGGAGSVVVEALSVTENGIYTAEEGYAYSPVNVNVSGGGGDEALAGLIDRSITNIDVPSGVTKIGERAFNLCASLVTVKIPESVTIIDSYAFANCIKLQTVTIEAVTPPQLAASSFNSTSALQHIYVPAESVDAYKAANNWSDKASKIQAIPSA